MYFLMKLYLVVPFLFSAVPPAFSLTPVTILSGGGGAAQQQEGQIRPCEEVPLRGLSRPESVCRVSHAEPSSGADDGGYKACPPDGVQDGRRALERGDTGTFMCTCPSPESASWGGKSQSVSIYFYGKLALKVLRFSCEPFGDLACWV